MGMATVVVLVEGREPCSGPESYETLEWLVWSPPPCFSAPLSLLSRHRDRIGPSRKMCRRGRNREIFVSSGWMADESRAGQPNGPGGAESSTYKRRTCWHTSMPSS